MGALKPISKIDKRLGGSSITADKHERLTLSKELQNEIEFTAGMELYLYFDEDERRIGISKTGSAGHTPYVSINADIPMLVISLNVVESIRKIRPSNSFLSVKKRESRYSAGWNQKASYI